MVCGCLGTERDWGELSRRRCNGDSLQLGLWREGIKITRSAAAARLSRNTRELGMTTASSTVNHLSRPTVSPSS
ncbi:hypothetical protein NL676_008858 [Syzygium grande]|nr:hypothetical protein NL676_008858 [Syzygium grande]